MHFHESKEGFDETAGAIRNGSNQIPESRRVALGKIAAVGLAAVPPAVSSPFCLSAPNTGKELDARLTNRWSQLKEMASSSYCRSLKEFGGQLTSDRRLLLHPEPSGKPWDFDVVIVGSGYGGSICAARLAEKMKPGNRICILERGREWVPGTFPDTLLTERKESQRPLFFRNNEGEIHPLGLINLLRGADLSVMSGSGLGGTSLINANVSLKPDREVFEQPAWPIPLRDRDFLEPYYARAEWELGVAQEPLDASPKMRIQREAAVRLADWGAHFEASALAVTRSPNLSLPVINRQGMIQPPCVGCGDCMTGCNVGAKNTLSMNYLPIARRLGVEMFTGTKVQCIEKIDGCYVIHYIHYLPRDNHLHAIHGKLRARIVILAAGSLGSTEILMKSQSTNFQFSHQLGCKWSGNGDILGIIHDTCFSTHSLGKGAYHYPGDIVGPTIQSNITFPRQPWHQRVLVQEGSLARAYVNAMMLLTRHLDLSRTQFLLVMGHDGTRGRLELDSLGQVAVRWRDYTNSPYRRLANQYLQRIAKVLRGRLEPIAAFRNQACTVHPLGGCALADSPAVGVLNHKCQVFDFAGGGAVDHETGSIRVHQGFYVCDGAVIPTSLGVNPFITIAAIAERTAHLMTREPCYQDLFYGPSDNSATAGV